VESNTSQHDTAGAPTPRRSLRLRDNLESVAIAILLVLAVRQLVLEPFKIPTGSMAPTLLGEHKEVRCPDCGWTFQVGHNRRRRVDLVRCPNCLYRWRGVGRRDMTFRWPYWLWHEAYDSATRAKLSGIDASNRVKRWGSRIFVNKFIYRLRKPRRWEVVVFAYPYPTVTCNRCGWHGEVKSGKELRCKNDLCGSTDVEVTRRNFIKRLVGLPGEQVEIQNGDVYITDDQFANGKIARKPPAVQKRLWQHVVDSRFAPRRDDARFWKLDPHANLWTENREDGTLELDAYGSESPIEAELARSVDDVCAYNAGQSRFSLPVGDLRIEVELTVEEHARDLRGGVVLRIEEDERDFSLFIPVGESARAELADAGVDVDSADVRGLRPGERVCLALENYDDRVVASLRGKPIITWEYDGNPWPRRRRRQVAFGAAGARVVFHRVKIQRDIYYLADKDKPQGPKTYRRLDDKSYFVLGDNSAQSSDSRAWDDPAVPEENLLGETFAVFWPIHDVRLISVGSRE